MTEFYAFTLEGPLPLLSPTFSLIEVVRARDRGRPITLVRPRSDIIERRLRGDTYFIDAFEADLRAIVSEEGELALLEVRRVERNLIPLAIFEPLDGWALRELAAFVRCDVEVAAALALAIHRTYDGGPNVVSRDGQLGHRNLPSFENVWDAEMPSFTGLEPELSIRGRIDESCALMQQLAGYRPQQTHEADAFRAELAALAHPDVGPALVRVLRDDYGMS